MNMFLDENSAAETGNMFLDGVVSNGVADKGEQDVISRVNSLKEESPEHFGFTKTQETPIGLIDRVYKDTLKTIGIGAARFAQSAANAELIGAQAVGEVGQQITGDTPITVAEGIQKGEYPSLISSNFIMLQAAGMELQEKLGTYLNESLGPRPDDWKGVVQDIGSVGGGVLASIGLTLATRSPTLAAELFGSIQGTQTYEKARLAGENQKTPVEALGLGLTTGSTVAALEAIGLKGFGALATSPPVKKVITRIIGQGAEEASQQAAVDTIHRVSGIEPMTNEEMAQDILYNGLLGMIGGAPVVTVTTIMEERAKVLGMTEDKARQLIDRFKANKNDVDSAVAQVIQNDLSGVADHSPDRKSVNKILNEQLAKEQEVDAAINKGEIDDPIMAARVILRTNQSDGVRAAVKGLMKNEFTLEDLRRTVEDNTPSEMTVEASSVESLKLSAQEAKDQRLAYIASLEQRMADIEVTLDTLNPEQRAQAEGEMTSLQQEASRLRAMPERVSPFADIDKKVAAMTPEQRQQRYESLSRKVAAGITPTTGEMYERDILSPAPNLSAALPPGTESVDRRALYQQLLASEKRRDGSRERLQDIGEDVNRMLANAFVPISTRLKNISEKLKVRLRQHEFTLRERVNEDQAVLKPFLEKFKKLSREDRLIMDFAMKNGDAAVIDEVAAANKMTAEVNALREMLNSIYKRASSVGLEIGYKENYFPRQVTKAEKLIAHFRSTDEWGQISQALREKEIEMGAPLDAEAKAELINTLLRGYGKSQLTLAKPANLKERRIDIITPEIAEYYAPIDQALLRYVTAINTNIETRRFLGKGTTASEYDNINDSIGWFVMQEMAEGNVKPAQEAELTEILQARFKQGRMGAFWRTYKNVEYLSTMGNPGAALTQVGDIAWALYKNGVYRTLKVLPGALAGKSKITREDINVEEIAAEFLDQGRMGKAVQAIFKVTGFNKMDALGKETLINGAFERYRAQAKKPSQSFRGSLESILGEEADAAIDDLKNGRVSRNVKLLLFNELLDMQPVALSEMPVAYLKMGNGRILYMLKTFTIKQFDVYRNEVFSQIRTDPVKGMRNLTRLLAFFIAMNAGADWLKDMLFNRDTPIEDHVANNIMRVIGVSKFQVYTARREGIGSMAGKSILPPFSVVDRGYKDIAKLIENGELEIDDLDSVQNAPIAGKLYYWWMGAGLYK